MATPPGAYPTRTVTSAWTRDTAAFDAYAGACTCGWTGSHQHPPTEAGRTAAEDQWEHAHARPPFSDHGQILNHRGVRL